MSGSMMSGNKSPFVLVDGSSYLFRAYHALPDLTNRHGLPTGAIHGVTNMLQRLLEDYRPSHMAVVFDAKGPTFRHEMYAKYKANRPPMPEDLAVQIEPTLELVKLMGLPLIVERGVEADDVIGTLAKQAAEAGMDVVISTGDKDMAQLVNERVSLINTMDGSTLDVDGVMEKFAVRPDQIVDYLALMGDKVDNIPGVPKCGPKTAAKWLATYGSLQGVMDQADSVKGKIGENLRASLEFLPLSQQLATIRLDVPLSESPEQLRVVEANKEALIEKLKALSFNTWLRQLGEGNGAALGDEDLPAVETDYDLVLEEAELNRWLSRLSGADYFAFDTETTSLDYMQARIVGVSFSDAPGQAAYVPCGHDYMDAPPQLSVEQVLEALRPLLEDPERPKVLQNSKYDAAVLANHGVNLRGVAYDTMLESYVLNSAAGRHDMDSLAARYLNHKTIHFEDIAGKGAKQLGFNEIALEQAAPYAAEDADITLRLHQRLWGELSEQPRLRALFEQIEMPVAEVIGRMERTGVRVDVAALKSMSTELGELMLTTQKAAYEEAGGPFNLASPKQIQKIFFEDLGLPVIKKTPKGQPSTAEDVLEKLAEDGHRLPRLILDYRGYAKLKSTYTDKLPLQVNSDSGRVHTSYHQAVANTGRLSSSDPNLQNIPVRTQQGRRIRQAFVPEEGAVMVAADYSQIELRIMAHLSGDAGLLSAFAQGADVHRATAAEVFGVDVEAVSGDQRRSAKAINFGLIYGMSAFGLARQLGISRSDAQAYVDRYFERYPGVLAYMERTREQASEQGYVETLFGRRLYLPNIKARNGQLRQGAERAAINAPMQGTAADIIKRAMIDVDAWIDSEMPSIKMIMQVHDELVFEVPEELLDAAKTTIAERMSQAASLDVPLIVDVGVGRNWDEAH